MKSCAKVMFGLVILSAYLVCAVHSGAITSFFLLWGLFMAVSLLVVGLLLHLLSKVSWRDGKIARMANVIMQDLGATGKEILRWVEDGLVATKQMLRYRAVRQPSLPPPNARCIMNLPAPRDLLGYSEQEVRAILQTEANWARFQKCMSVQTYCLGSDETARYYAYEVRRFVANLVPQFEK